MTTGRINQVTILSRLAKRTPADSPKRASITRLGDTEAPQIATLKAPKTPTASTTDSIAPTEFPKKRSATGLDRCYHRNTSATYTPQEEKIYALSRKLMRKRGKMVPKDLVNIWHRSEE